MPAIDCPVAAGSSAFHSAWWMSAYVSGSYWARNPSTTLPSASPMSLNTAAACAVSVPGV